MFAKKSGVAFTAKAGNVLVTKDFANSNPASFKPPTTPRALVAVRLTPSLTVVAKALADTAIILFLVKLLIVLFFLFC